VEFLESCKLKSRCPKGFKKVNDRCENCKFYNEEKIVNIPRPVNQMHYEEFTEELEEFSEWIQKKISKKIQFWGSINSVKPHLEKKVYPGKEILLQRGYIVSFKSGYIDKDFLEDYTYLLLNDSEFKNIKPHPGDEIEFKGTLFINKGRVILTHPSNYLIMNRKKNESIEDFDISSANITGSTIDIQMDKCFNCEKGILIDVTDKKVNRTYRRIFCMKGIAEPKNCYHFALVQEEKKSNEDNKNEED
jgi:hypothetical protein